MHNHPVWEEDPYYITVKKDGHIGYESGTKSDVYFIRRSHTRNRVGHGFASISEALDYLIRNHRIHPLKEDF